MSALKKLLLPMLLMVGIGHAFSQTSQSAATKTFGIKYEKFVLDNGLEVVLHEDHSDPIVAVSTIVHVGSNREKPGKTGFAHFFEHMSFNHSENTPRGANRKLIPEWGGSRNGGTWNDGTIYYEVIPKDAFEKILWIDSDRLGYMINTVTKEALEKEIQVVKNEKRQNNDNVPYGNTNEVIMSNMYPKEHPYNWTVIGLLPDLQAATLEDVKEFYDKYYGAANATLVIAGDIDIAQTKERVKLWFGEIRKGPAVAPLKPRPVKLTAAKSLYYEDNFATLPELTLVFPTVEEYHKDGYVLNVLAELLSGSKTAPLYKVIVEDKKLAPSVNAYHYSKEIAGEFYIRIRGNAGTKLNDIKTAVDEALNTFDKAPFPVKDLERIKAKLETDLYLSIENILDKAQRLGQDNEFKGDPGYISKEAAILQAVTSEDVKRVFNQYIKNRPYIATSFVPKGKKELAMDGALPATVWVEPVIAGIENENVAPGEDAKFEKTKTKHDRSEPAFGETPMFRMPPIWTSSQANGMKVFGLETSEIPLVNFEVVLNGGHWADPMEKSGVSSLLAGMLMQGTATKTAAQLEEAIDLLGANITVTSHNEEMRISATCLQRNFERTFALMQEILLQPRWDKTEYERLYQALLTNLKGREANATAIAAINFNKLLYGDQHIFGYPATGTLKTVSVITLEDLKTYYDKYFSPSIASFHIAGDITRERVKKSIAALENDWKPKQVALPSYQIPVEVNAGSIFFIDVPGSKQSVLYVGKLAVPATDPNSDRLEFANEILGSGSSGRLTQVLRIGKGYTYGASSTLVKLKETSPFAIYTSVRANATLASLEVIRDMLRDYGQTFGEPEVSITKNKVLKRNTLLYKSQASKLAMLGEISKYGKSLKFLEDKQQQLINMQLPDFKTTIQEQMKEQEMIYLVVGDKATQFEEVKKLGKAKLVELDINGRPL
ncbi:MAG: pitrilysin family protein [Dyadobacter sp.]|uniref:M16 family metallopeptidase n=1 Tax=Dyadobacter sp. TaxID=1914288 RepID=UPI0032640092